jgi:hypothetical protein
MTMSAEEEEPKVEKFSLSSLFGNSGGATTATKPNLRKGRPLEPHPSVRPHISPLNSLAPGVDHSGPGSLPVHPDVRSGMLPNGMNYIILPNRSPPGRFEAHLQVYSGSCTSNEIPSCCSSLFLQVSPFILYVWRSIKC